MSFKSEEIKLSTRLSLNDDEDEKKRENNFAENDERIEDFNNRENKTYEQGHNEYSDENFDDSKKARTGLKIPKSLNSSTSTASRDNKSIPTIKLRSNEKLPNFVDHSKNLPPAKDQKRLEMF